MINGQGIMQSQVMREHAQIRESQVIMTCIAMGYPNHEFAPNQVQSWRTPNEEIVTYTGFDQ